MASPQETLDIIKRGVVHLHSEKELLEKLSTGKPLRVKLGVDPTSPDLHLGHSVALTKLRQFQELGHTVVLIIGDFTAMIGDPTGRSATRPQLTHADVLANAETYKEQAFKVLEKDRVEVVHNGDWFSKMTFTEVIKLNASVTLQQMLQREDFRSRYDGGQEVRLHELQYPIMQGYDSVMVRSDVEIGGSDQLFNILVGRDMQRAAGMPQQVALTMPLLEGTDGVKKMSKSYKNYIGLNEPATEIFGKAMSISDELMARYYLLLLGEPLPADSHPMEAKKALAWKLACRFQDAAAADAARINWEATFSKKNYAEAELPVFTPGEDKRAMNLVREAYLTCFQQEKSGGQVRQLIQQGSVQIDGEKMTDPAAVLDLPLGAVLKLDKKCLVRIG
jgi:tyrosyl-tRNA synthetase